MFDVFIQAYEESLEEVGKSYVLEVVFLCFCLLHIAKYPEFWKINSDLFRCLFMNPW